MQSNDRFKDWHRGQGLWADIPEKDWNNWAWQLKNRITKLEQLEKLIDLTPEERAGSLFANQKLKHKMLGEATVTYLYKYQEAIPKIKKYLGFPKIIIILRNPIYRSFSQYSYACELGFENLSFLDSIQAEKNRLLSNWSSTFAYIDQGKYYNQIKAYKDSFPDVKIVILEEFVKDKQKTLKDIYRFLDVNQSFLNDFSETHNKSGIPYNKYLHNFIVHDNFLEKLIRKISSPFISKSSLRKLNRNLRTLNQSHSFTIKDEEINFLKDIYNEEITKIKKYLELDQNLWI